MAAQGFLSLVNGIMTMVRGTLVGGSATYANQIPALDASGKLDASMLPTGVGPECVTVVASEALTAGAMVNLWSNAGVTNARLADCSSSGKQAHGFVLAACAPGATATVYLPSQINSGLTALTPAAQYWLGTAGAVTVTPPNTAGYLSQVVGVANGATSLTFIPGPAIVLA